MASRHPFTGVRSISSCIKGGEKVKTKNLLCRHPFTGVRSISRYSFILFLVCAHFYASPSLHWCQVNFEFFWQLFLPLWSPLSPSLHWCQVNFELAHSEGGDFGILAMSPSLHWCQVNFELWHLPRVRSRGLVGRRHPFTGVRSISRVTFPVRLD